jgi:prepilin-type N-terminal cleavage/methylation domain-containing protein
MAAVSDAPDAAGSVGSPPNGFSLTELLVAAALSLVVMGAVAALFGILSRSIRQSQATVDLGSLMRSAAWQLRQDLTGLTCTVAPWVAPETSSGYFELLEGPRHDASSAIDAQGQPTTSLTADTDDLLLFTTQSLAEPLVGRYEGTLIESPCAEVAWFCRPCASQPVAGTTLYDLHRRQLLVTSYLGRSSLANNALSGTANRAAYDLSLRSGTIAGQGNVLLPNSLGDLTKREHRFMRSGLSFVTTTGAVRSVPAQTFPFPFPLAPASGADGFHALSEASLAETTRAGEDVILTNVIAFDVRVYDPQAIAPIASGTLWRLPGDRGYDAALASGTAGFGAYVDLGWRGGRPSPQSASFPPTGTSALQSAGVCVSGTRTLTVAGTGTAAATVPTYDTWSRHYEHNGLDDDGDGVVDEGSNGVDADGDGWPDDSGAAETSAPYPVPLRGIEVRIRCYEPNSKQVRQITIRHALRR